MEYKCSLTQKSCFGEMGNLMKLEKREKRYYVNSALISSKALNMIFGEILKVKSWREILVKLSEGKNVNIEFEEDGVTRDYDLEKNRLLERKLKAIEEALIRTV